MLGCFGVSHARGRSSEIAVIVGLFGLCVVLWLLRGAIEPAPPPNVSRRGDVATTPVPSPAPPVSQPTVQTSPPRPEPRESPELRGPEESPEFRGNDAVDPCTAGVEPRFSSSYDTVVAQGITVAWSPGEVTNPRPYDVTIKPTAVAYLVTGLLAEAADLTGTRRRERLTVVLYPSKNDFVARTGIPAWADGLYDGGAVRLAVDPGTDLGVNTTILRHELMHAQLHTAVGCMPAWFNEGLAMYFAGTPPARPWVQMLRSPDDFDLTSLQASTLAHLPGDRAERAYAESLAMILFLIDRSGEAGIKTAVQTLAAAVRESPRAGLTLWERLYPRTRHRDVLNVLAQKVFGMALGSELDAVFTATVCCYGFRTVRAFGCRGAPARSDKTTWIDQSSSPHAVCRATW